MVSEKTINAMESFIKNKTDIDFSFSIKNDVYYLYVIKVLKSIIANETKVVSNKLCKEYPNIFCNLKSEEDVYDYILKDLPNEKSFIKNIFKQELINIAAAEDYLKQASEELNSGKFKSPSEEKVVLEDVFGANKEEEINCSGRFVGVFEDQDEASLTLNF